MITVHNLHHVNIETAKFEETRAFYEDLLGLTVGRRDLPDHRLLDVPS